MIPLKPHPVTSPLPAYIERHGDLVARHPFMQQGTFLRSFLLEAEEAKLQALCDRVFNHPSGGALNFRPLSNSIFLTFAEIENIYSQHGEDSLLGSMFEIDVAFWIPLLSERNGKPRISWYIPYVFVDNPFAMASGRELYGFPKTLGQFQIPREMTSPLPYRVETMVLETFRPSARIQPVEIIEVVRRDGNPKTKLRADSLHALSSMFIGENQPFTTRFSIGWTLVQTALKEQAVNMLFLRQLRDIQDPTRAAYQEVIEAPSQVARVRKGGFLPGSFEVRLTPNATFPIADELGLNPEGHPVKAAFWVDFDFTVGLGKTVWRGQMGMISEALKSLQ